MSNMAPTLGQIMKKLALSSDLHKKKLQNALAVIPNITKIWKMTRVRRVFSFFVPSCVH